jgi:hypothetical protein
MGTISHRVRVVTAQYLEQQQQQQRRRTQRGVQEPHAHHDRVRVTATGTAIACHACLPPRQQQQPPVVAVQVGQQRCMVRIRTGEPDRSGEDERRRQPRNVGLQQHRGLLREMQPRHHRRQLTTGTT